MQITKEIRDEIESTQSGEELDAVTKVCPKGFFVVPQYSPNEISRRFKSSPPSELIDLILNH